MKPWVSSLLREAERRVPGLQFNEAAFEARNQAAEAHGQAVHYEISLDAELDLGEFAPLALTRLQDHLQAKRAPAGAPGLLVWIWYDEHAHLFPGTRFEETLCALTGATALLPPPS